MPQRAGLCILLSFALVVSVSALLYRPDLPTPAGDSPTPAEATPTTPADGTDAAFGPSPPPTEGDPYPSTPLTAEAWAPVHPTSVKIPTPAGRPQGPRKPFTTVQKGESLADVARRVYGGDGPDEQDRIRRANRDLIVAAEGTLPAGVPLRTP